MLSPHARSVAQPGPLLQGSRSHPENLDDQNDACDLFLVLETRHGGSADADQLAITHHRSHETIQHSVRWGSPFDHPATPRCNGVMTHSHTLTSSPSHPTLRGHTPPPHLHPRRASRCSLWRAGQLPEVRMAGPGESHAAVLHADVGAGAGGARREGPLLRAGDAERDGHAAGLRARRRPHREGACPGAGGCCRAAMVWVGGGGGERLGGRGGGRGWNRLIIKNSSWHCLP